MGLEIPSLLSEFGNFAGEEGGKGKMRIAMRLALDLFSRSKLVKSKKGGEDYAVYS